MKCFKTRLLLSSFQTAMIRTYQLTEQKIAKPVLSDLKRHKDITYLLKSQAISIFLGNRLILG